VKETPQTIEVRVKKLEFTLKKLKKGEKRGKVKRPHWPPTMHTMFSPE